jgi:ABC-type thiamin/hydroxymethylpyrimidine transport system permease subunit
LRFTTKELALIIVFSSLGAVLSVPVGYLGNYFKTIPILPLGTGQILSGIHLVSLTLTALFLKKRGVATMTGLIKGLVEAILFSFHGVPVILMSALQGLVIDAMINTFGERGLAVYLGCGFASASSVAFIQFFLLLPFPLSVFGFMYILAFISGAVFGGYVGLYLYKKVGTRISLSEFQL